MGLLTKIKRSAATEPVATAGNWKLLNVSTRGEVATVALAREGGLPLAGLDAEAEVLRRIGEAASQVTSTAAFARWVKLRQTRDAEREAAAKAEAQSTAAVLRVKELLADGRMEEAHTAGREQEEQSAASKRHAENARTLESLILEARAAALAEQRKPMEAVRDELHAEAQAAYQQKAADLAERIGTDLMELLALGTRVGLTEPVGKGEEERQARVLGRRTVLGELNKLPGDDHQDQWPPQKRKPKDILDSDPVAEPNEYSNYGGGFGQWTRLIG